ncbi:MAG TPA: serine acetyltransferase [Myxococcales bacterium]|jgi:serine O-acetyltransferase
MLNALDLHRMAQRLQRAGLTVAPRALRKLIQFLYGSYIGTEAEIGEGTELAYGGLGIVIHPASRLGRNVLVGPRVTIGGRSLSKGAPVIEDDVKIGAGACLLGDIRVGHGALIGANAVVTHDVPPNAVVAGVPAREIGRATDGEGKARTL